MHEEQNFNGRGTKPTYMRHKITAAEEQKPRTRGTQF
jgi:hypothetical protein